MGEIKLLNQNHEKDTDTLVGMMGTKDYDRFLRIRDSTIPTTERLYVMWRMISNQIVRLRREARREIQNMHDLNRKKSELEKHLNAENAKTFKNMFIIEQLESLVRSQNEIIKSTRDVLAVIGELTTTNLGLYELVATDHDFAQLINANIQNVARFRKDREKRGRINSSFFSDLIFVYKVESEPEQPLFEAMFMMFWWEIDRNKELRRRTKDKADKLFPALKHIPRYVLHKDEHGNQVAEQVYQLLELV